jgi:demethylmenaquinone methyltransferase/2-methoxy-6-polyprenyl-1,4-benzoquinol methylase
MAQRFTLKIGENLQSAEKKREYNEKVFSEVAPRYDFITRALSFWQDASWKRDLINSLPAQEAPLCVDIARRRNTRRNISFINQDMGRLEFAPESVDIVTGGYALRNAPDLEIVIGEIHRSLKPGGTADFLDFSKPHAGFAQRLEYALLKIWGGFWGLLLHRNHEVYSYIAESLRLFPERARLLKIFRDKGFTVGASRLYFFGITELLVVRKDAQ